MNKKLKKIIFSLIVFSLVLGTGAIINIGNFQKLEGYMYSLAASIETSATSSNATSSNATSSNATSSNATINSLPFKDVIAGKWYVTAIDYCYNNKIIYGTSNDTFAPDTKITRGMLVTILHRMEGSPKVSEINKFTDVDSTKWYGEAIKWASKNKIVHGYEGTTKFGPNDNITREQLVVILSNYAKYKGKNMSGVTTLDSFADGNKVSSWASNGMKWAIKNKVMYGSNGNLNPKGTATRAEAASMIYNYCNKVK